MKDTDRLQKILDKQQRLQDRMIILNGCLAFAWVVFSIIMILYLRSGM